jgi:hypothetical protein
MEVVSKEGTLFHPAVVAGSKPALFAMHGRGLSFAGHVRLEA